MRNVLRAFLADQRGVTVVEYGLIAVLVSVAIIGGLMAFTDAFSQLIAEVNGKL